MKRVRGATRPTSFIWRMMTWAPVSMTPPMYTRSAPEARILVSTGFWSGCFQSMPSLATTGSPIFFAVASKTSAMPLP